MNAPRWWTRFVDVFRSEPMPIRALRDMQRAARVRRNRSEGAKRGWETRRFKKSLDGPDIKPGEEVLAVQRRAAAINWDENDDGN